MKPRLLDLFCGAGGAAMGYHRAGFDVVGVDIKPQPHYPFEFIQADALEFLGAVPMNLYPGNGRIGSFDAIHASPPCQTHVKGLAAVNASLGRAMHHHDYIAATRDRLTTIGLPWIMENVEAAPLLDTVRLCGTSFGLPLRRHRLFESSIALLVPPCAHRRDAVGKYWTSWVPNGQRRRATTVQVYGNGAETHEWGPAMEIDWMSPKEMAEAIPPAYTTLLGSQLLSFLAATAVRSAVSEPLGLPEEAA